MLAFLKVNLKAPALSYGAYEFEIFTEGRFPRIYESFSYISGKNLTNTTFHYDIASS